MKNIISFSLWGSNPKYAQGAVENLKIANKLFPNWICRIYHYDDVPIKYLYELRILGAELIEKRYDNQGMIWRFEPLLDHTIDRFIVRDTDSILTLRDRNAVLDWITTGKEFHIIRDHIMHGTRIMGGMWGATSEFIKRIDYKKILESHDFKNTPHVFGYDQDFLAQKIYPLVRNTACIHDDYHLFRDENPRNIPHIREGNHFIGEPIER